MMSLHAVARADGLPISYIEGTNPPTFNPSGLVATETLPPQCAGYHAALAIANYTATTHTVQYYGGSVAIPGLSDHIFCIGGTANNYIVEFSMLGYANDILRVDIP
jgi:hypothetical protein